MERAVFVIESDNSQIPCLLNPDTLTVQRSAGVRLRTLSRGPIVQNGSNHDPLLYTAGGRTELTIDLLFDASLANELSPAATRKNVTNEVLEDVRELTQPLMGLAESGSSDPDNPAAFARFIWGKAWNLRGVVLAAAERLEFFTDAGVPQRSWLRMRFVVVPEKTEQRSDNETTAYKLPLSIDPAKEIDPDDMVMHFTLNESVTASGHASSERLDEIAYTHYGDPSLWRLIASLNHIEDPLSDLSGRVLQIPPASAAEVMP